MTTLKEIDDRYYQYCNVVMLPTNDKPIENNIGMNISDNSLQLMQRRHLGNKFFDTETGSSAHGIIVPQHLYITTSDKINAGDWYFNSIANKVFKFSYGGLLYDGINRKVIATTNLLLKIHKFKKGVLKNLEYNLPQLPQQFIEKFIEAYNNNVGIDEVLVENEKATYEKWIKNGATPVFDTLKVNSDNTINVKLIKESYTRAELIKLLNEFGEHVCNELLGHRLSMIGELNKWAEENL